MQIKAIGRQFVRWLFCMSAFLWWFFSCQRQWHKRLFPNFEASNANPHPYEKVFILFGSDGDIARHGFC